MVLVLFLGTFIILWVWVQKIIVGNACKIKETQQCCNWKSTFYAKFLWFLIDSKPLDNDVIKIRLEVGNPLVGLVRLTCDGMMINWFSKSTVHIPVTNCVLGDWCTTWIVSCCTISCNLIRRSELALNLVKWQRLIVDALCFAIQFANL